MENTIELNEINEVDLGDNTLTVDPTPRSGVAGRTECTLDELVVVESESGDGDGDGDGVRSVSGFVSGARAGTVARARAGGEGGSAAFQK
jgi:hypothetical protein